MIRPFRKDSIFPLVLLSILLFAVLVMMNQSIQSAGDYSDNFISLAIFGLVCLLLLFWFVGRFVYRLIISYRRGIMGSRLNARMVIFFAGLSLVPLCILLYFSITLIYRSIDSWFDESLDKGFDDAIALSRSALEVRRLDALRLTQNAGEQLSQIPTLNLAYYLEDIRDQINAQELSIYNMNGDLISFSASGWNKVLPESPNEVILMTVAEGVDYVALEQISETQLRVRVITKINSATPFIIQGFYEVPDRYTSLANSTKQSVEYYKQYKVLREPFKYNLMAILGMVSMLSILLALGGSFFAARRLVNPIRDLSIATKAVADGDLERKIKVKSNDEIGFLTHSFNEMTNRLKEAHQIAQRSQSLLESERSHLVSLLAKLSSGVLVIDVNGKIRTYNQAAINILGVAESSLQQFSLDKLENSEDALKSFMKPLFEFLDENDQKEWRTEFSRYYDGQQQIFSLRGSEQADQIGLKGGKIIVFDDITQLISSERESAWSEVARRLAHEIKNPLTPIQLSAERLKLRFSDKFIDKDKEVIDKSTETIISQVKAMKTMVDEFSQYAKTTQSILSEIELNALINEVMYLYQDYPSGLMFNIELSEGELYILGDSIRLRQLLHNLIKNAIEACPDNIGTITIRTELLQDVVRLEISDTGVGFEPSQMNNIFEPYVTTKVKGTGLGLAIVKKIIEEHHGKIAIYSEGKMMGAQIVISFPKIIHH